MREYYQKNIVALNGISRGKEILASEKRVVLRSKKGKTLVVYAKVNNGMLEEIVFGGDYFAYPEDAILVLEEKLRGLGLDDALKTIDKVLGNTILLGISVDDLKTSIRRVFEDSG